MKNPRFKIISSIFVCLILISSIAYGQKIDKSWFNRPSAPTHAGNAPRLPDLIISYIKPSYIPIKNPRIYRGKIDVAIDVKIENIGNRRVYSNQSFYLILITRDGRKVVPVTGGIGTGNHNFLVKRIVIQLPYYYSNKKIGFEAYADPVSQGRGDKTIPGYRNKIRESNENNNIKAAIVKIPSYRRR